MSKPLFGLLLFLAQAGPGPVSGQGQPALAAAGGRPLGSGPKDKGPRRGTFKDPRDGRSYKTIQIGNLVWMAENLAYKPATGNCWAYDNAPSHAASYGYLYDWPTALRVAPAGWHLASDAEWTELTRWVGPDPGTRLKAARGWKDQGDGTDDHGFSALPGGYRGREGNFERLGGGAYFWSATGNSSTEAWGRGMSSSNGNVGRGYDDKAVGYAVRCVKDAPRP